MNKPVTVSEEALVTPVLVPEVTAEADARAKAAGPAYIVLAGISFSHFLNDTMQSLIASVYPILKANYALDFAQIGMITLAFQFTASLLQPVIGYVTDKKAQPFSLAAGMGFTFFGLLMLAVAGQYATILIAASLVGLGSAVFHPESARIARLASGGRYGFAQSVFQLGGSFGTSMGPVLAALIVVPFGQPSIAWFSIIDCDVCAYLPHKKELARSDTPAELEDLETLHSDVTRPERYTTDSVYIKRCTVCGTHYHHDHRIDTEDSVATPPSISQHLMRYDLLALKETLQAVGLLDERAAVEQRYPDLIASWKNTLQTDAATLRPNILPYLVENVVDSLILHDRFAELEASLLRHPRAEVALETAKNLIWIHGAARRVNPYPYGMSYRDVTNAVQDKLKPWLQANLTLLQDVLLNLLQTADESFKKRVEETRATAQYAKLL